MRDMPSKPRDLTLIDKLDALDGFRFEGNVWRVVRAEKNPIDGQRSGGRWDPGTFDVLYCSLETDGAIAEVDYVLSVQPVRPSKINFILHELAIAAERILQLTDMEKLSGLGIEMSRYHLPEYQRSQEIGDAAYFLDFDGLIVPSARWRCDNLVLFTDKATVSIPKVLSSQPINFEEWRNRVKAELRDQHRER